MLPLRARLTWIGLWTHCDDQGRTKDNARLIKGDIWPLDDVSLAEIEEDLETLAARGRIVRYEVDGRRYLEVTNWSEHQKIQKPSPSRLPPPPHHSDSPPVALPDSYRGEGKGKEGKGGDARERADPRRCPAHQHDPDPPNCGACADARRRTDAAAASLAAERVEVRLAIEAAKQDLAQECRHHTAGGQFIHPDTGVSATCAFCRHEQERAS